MADDLRTMVQQALARRARERQQAEPMRFDAVLAAVQAALAEEAARGTDAPPAPVDRPPTGLEALSGATSIGPGPLSQADTALRGSPSLHPAIRPSTWSERAQDTVQDAYASLVGPGRLGTITDAVGMTDLAGKARELSEEPEPGQAMGVPLDPMGSFETGVGRGLVSRVDEALKLIPKNGAHPNKIASILKNNASAEEVAWRKIPEFLASKGNATVTPAELAAHLQAHPAPIPKVKTLSDTGDLAVQQRVLQRRVDAARDRAFPGTTTHGQPWPGSERMTQLQDVNARTWAWAAAEGDAHARAMLEKLPISPEHRAAILEYGDLSVQSRTLNEQALSARPKHARYQVPGGTDYRETLLTLPPQEGLPPGYSIQPLEGNRAGKFTLVRPDGSGHVLASTSLWDARKAALDYLQSRGITAPVYNPPAGHYTEPNLLVHTRANTRELPDVGTGTFGEEIQSDWASAGRESGFHPPDIQRINEELERASAKFARRNQRQQQLAAGQWSGDIPTDSEALATATREAQEAWAEVEALRKQLGGVPDMPFKEAETELGLKSLVLDAVERDHDWVGFTGAQTQKARYDLSKQVSKVHYDQSSHTLTAWDNPGRIRDRRTVLQESNVTPENLKDWIGKEAAERILAQTPDEEGVRVLEGLDLQVGGEGMDYYYDQLYPKRLEKLLKPHGGGPVERGAVPTVPPDVAARVPPGHPYGGSFSEPVWFSRLTPEMRENIRKNGLSLLSIAAILKLADEHQEPEPKD